MLLRPCGPICLDARCRAAFRHDVWLGVQLAAGLPWPCASAATAAGPFVAGSGVAGEASSGLISSRIHSSRREDMLCQNLFCSGLDFGMQQQSFFQGFAYLTFGRSPRTLRPTGHRSRRTGMRNGLPRFLFLTNLQHSSKE